MRVCWYSWQNLAEMRAVPLGMAYRCPRKVGIEEDLHFLEAQSGSATRTREPPPAEPTPPGTRNRTPSPWEIDRFMTLDSA